MKKYDYIIVGTGFAGSVIAEKVASKERNVLMIDKRDHIGGNAFDYKKEDILIHKYGPHIFHTNNEEVFNFLSHFTKWEKYEHKVLGHVEDKLIPIPFNLKSIEECFGEEKASKLKNQLLKEYEEGSKVAILELLKNEDNDVKELANYVFENIFKYYTMKQWGLKAEEIDPNVTARVPVNVSYDDRYFNDKYQYMPKYGYTKLFENMLACDYIDVRLNTDVKDVLELKDGKIYFEDNEFEGKVIYTGEIDYLFDYALGTLPYRSLDLRLERHEDTFQKAATENYPGPKEQFPYTRISEYKHFTSKIDAKHTYVHVEYPMAYVPNENVPYYPIFTEDNQKKYQEYVNLAKEYKNLYLLGRLAEYSYYNMDAIVLKALNLAEEIIKN